MVKGARAEGSLVLFLILGLKLAGKQFSAVRKCLDLISVTLLTSV